MYKLLIRPILFCFDPEKVHYFTFSMIQFLCKIPGFTFLMKSVYEVNDKKLEVEIAGLKFKNPVVFLNFGSLLSSLKLFHGQTS